MVLTEDSDAFFVAGEQSDYVHSDTSPGNEFKKRSLTAHFPSVKPHNSLSRLERLRNAEDLKFRAQQFLILSSLNLNSLDETDGNLVRKALLTQSSDLCCYKDIVRVLFKGGKVLEGLMLCGVFRSSVNVQPNGDDVLHRFLREATVKTLIPSIFGIDNGHAVLLPVEDLETLFESLTFRARTCLPFVSCSHEDGGYYEGTRQTVETCVSIIIELVAHYAFHFPSLAVETAHAFIDNAPFLMPIPSRLEEILLFGSNASPKIGLFAQRNLKTQEGFTGDPAKLLSLYIMNGMPVEAVRVIETILTDTYPRDTVGKVSPERGGIQIVPYDKVDFLYDMLSVAMEDRSKSKDTDVVSLENARNTLEAVMDRHFQLLSLNESSLLAARRAS